MWKKKKSKRIKKDNVGLNFFCEGVKHVECGFKDSMNRFHHTDFGECDHVRNDF